MRKHVVAPVALLLALAGWLCLSPLGAETTMPTPDLDPVVRVAHPPLNPQPTYNGEVASIVDHNCVACHRTGGTAPFPLTDYVSVRRHAKDVAKATKERTMPPWKPAAGWGSFAGERRLEAEDIATLQAWVQQGSPQGTGLRPVPPQFSDGWTLGRPDLIVSLAKPFEVPADGPDVYHCFILPLPLDHDTPVAAIDFQPDNPRVVHHALLFLDNLGRARAHCQGPLADGYSSFGGPGFVPSGALGGWVPGTSPERLPEGVVRMIQKGSDLVVQIHFHPSGKVEHAQPRLGLYFGSPHAHTVLNSLALASLPLRLPAGDAHHVLRDDVTLSAGVTLYGIAPHAHLLCKDIQAVATLPDGHVRPLIWIPDWDFAWQGQYVYREPVHLPAGTRIDVRYTYDNSAGNPRNPNRPPKDVHFGEQTTDEMALLFMAVVPDHPDDMVQLKRSMRQRALRRLLSPDGLPTLLHILQRSRNQT